MSRPSHPILFDHPNNISWTVQIMKLLIMHSSSPSSLYSCTLILRYYLYIYVLLSWLVAPVCILTCSAPNIYYLCKLYTSSGRFSQHSVSHIASIHFHEAVRSYCPSYMEPPGSLLCSHETATGSYPESDESNPHIPTIFPKDTS